MPPRRSQTRTHRRAAWWAAALVALAAPPGAEARQLPPPEPFTPPVAGSWVPVRSMGQPPRWKPFLALSYGWDRDRDVDASSGVSASLGLFRDVLNPMFGVLGFTGEAYGGQRGRHVDGGVRLLVESPLYSLHLGIDRSLGRGESDLVVGTSFPLRRGGWPLPGGLFRAKWFPTRENSFEVGASFPLGQPFAGRTRPRTVDVELPRPPKVRRTRPPPPGTAVRAALDEALESMTWLTDLHSFFWLTDVQSLRHSESLRRWRESLHAFRAELDGRNAPGEAWRYGVEVERYHGALDRAFGLALGAPENEARARGRALGDLARRVALEEVVLPYNRTIGRYKQPDRLGGLVARARARFIARLDVSREVPPGAGSLPVLGTLDAWLGGLEAARKRTADVVDDSRMHWLPLSLVLRPEEHATQDQIDELVARAVGRPFEGGNATLYLDAPSFQTELLRSIHQTRTYHVLWVHDFRGVDERGEPDRTAFRVVTEGYLEALLERVRRYDETGQLPAYIVLEDQYFYEANQSRLWLTLLERPLDHRVHLPDGFEAMEARIGQLQDSLRAAVARSRRLQAEGDALGEDWIRDVVKVHVNVTNPSDFSFRSRRLLGARLGADNLLRDHRKIVVRDVTEADPGRGEAILSGVGVGDHYATATWEDRTLLIQGPAALPARDMARHVLVRNGIPESDVPPALRPVARGDGYAERIRELEASGADARVLQLHNETGWGRKDATFAQMLLYDLAPPGTVIYVPDSMWSSYQWMAQLVNAALRGCRVFVVAPALDNAPSDGFVPVTVMQELLSRLVLVGDAFDDAIAREGGALRVGIFTRDAPLAGAAELVAELERGLTAGVLQSPGVELSREARAALDDVRGAAVAPANPDGHPAPASASGGPAVDGASDGHATAATNGHETGPRDDGATVPADRVGRAPPAGNPDRLTPTDASERRPLLHRKTQLMVSGALLDRLVRSPELAPVLRFAVEELAGTDGPTTAELSGPLVRQRRMRASLEMVDLFRSLSPDPDGVLYFMTGSINKNTRSMALDGEVLAVVAGEWSLQAFVDFALLTSGVTWVESVPELELFLPPFSTLERWIGRWLQKVM